MHNHPARPQPCHQAHRHRLHSTGGQGRGVGAVGGQSRSVRPLRAGMGWCPQCHMMRADCFNPGDWACSHCGQHNFGDKNECSNFRCQRQREELEFAPFESPWCISCKKLKTVCFMLNDWECPWCCNHNFARKQALRVRNRTYECHSYECHS